MKFLVRGLSDEELASVYGGTRTIPSLACHEFFCGGKQACYAYCPEVTCGALTCDMYKSDNFLPG